MLTHGPIHKILCWLGGVGGGTGTTYYLEAWVNTHDTNPGEDEGMHKHWWPLPVSNGQKKPKMGGSALEKGVGWKKNCWLDPPGGGPRERWILLVARLDVAGTRNWAKKSPKPVGFDFGLDKAKILR